MELILIVAVAGILTGILVGLLPVLPIYFGPFVLYYFLPYIELEHMLIFWTSVLIGSQYFGSITTITTGIPGEASSIVYLNDTNKMSLSEKNKLLYQTAKGSLVATFFGVSVLYGLVQYAKSADDLLFFSSVEFQMIAYTTAILSFLLLSRKFLVTLGLIILAIVISPNSNYALPDTWFQIQLIFQGYTIYLVVLGVLIIPEVISYNSKLKKHESHFEANHKATLNVFQTIKASVIGIVSGLIPGPNSILASAFAYKATTETKQKVVNAEVANNSAVISALLPFITIGIPITSSSLIFSNLLDIKAITLPETIFLPSSISGVNTFELTALSIIIVSVIMYYLAINFIDVYVRLIDNLHNKMKYIMVGIVGLLIAFDLYASELTLMSYMLLLMFFTAIGVLLKNKNIDAVPFMFMLLLGDKVIWTYMQYYKINF
jgi:putative tricarboxylic transport membrane protein